MHPMPLIEELRRFEGDAIAQIWLDPHGVRFLFENMDQITIHERLEHLEPDGTLWTYNCDARMGEPIVLHRLLYKRITAVEREDLKITFRIDDGSSLAIFSELGPYESGGIWPARGEGWLVF